MFTDSWMLLAVFVQFVSFSGSIFSEDNLLQSTFAFPETAMLWQTLPAHVEYDDTE